MAFRSVGINLPRLFQEGVSGLADDLEALKIAGPDFAEVWPAHLGVILGGSLDAERSQRVRERLLKTDLAYGPRPARGEPHGSDRPRRSARRPEGQHLVREQHRRGRGGVPCRPAVRLARRPVQFARAARRRAGCSAGGGRSGRGTRRDHRRRKLLPELLIISGVVYDYSVWPSELAEQISAVDHPAVGLCLDVGHAALAAGVFGFDYFEECAAVAPLVRHIHLHDNLMRTNVTGEPPVSEHPIYGLGDLHLPPGRGIPSMRCSGGWTSRKSRVLRGTLPDLYSLAPEAIRAARELIEPVVVAR